MRRFAPSCLLSLLSIFPVALAQVDQPSQGEYQHELSLAGTALQERDYEAAKAHYSRANELTQARMVEPLRGLAWAELRLDDAYSALTHARSALTLASDDVERGDIHNLLGAILYSEFISNTTNISKLEGSEKEFRSALQFNPRLVGAYFNLGKDLLKESRDQEGVAMLRKYLEFAPDAPNRSEVMRLIDNPRLSRGELAPSFSLQDTKGETISLSSLHGRIVLLDFWATWCGPCIASLPDIRKLARQYPADQFALISINEDEDADAWTKFLAKTDMNWPQCRDKDWALFHSFGLAPTRKIVVPAYIVLDRDGLVLHKARGLEDASSLAKVVQDAISTKH
jgi:peroxiredoxin